MITHSSCLTLALRTQPWKELGQDTPVPVQSGWEENDELPAGQKQQVQLAVDS
jgi:hypothetical protein